MASKGPWLVAVGLDLLANGADEDVAVSKLLMAADGRREALRGAYTRALALAAELPNDRQARLLVHLVSRAMRGDRLSGVAAAG
jgi:hypothetical protein